MSDVHQKPTGRLHKTREEEADRCLNHTEFSRGSALLVSVCFLGIVFGIPLLQHVVEVRRNLEQRSNWSTSSGQQEPQLLPQVYDVFGLLPTRQQIAKAKGFWGYWSLIPSGESIGAFESKLKENSVLTQSLLSPAQYAMTGWLGVGNEKAYCGMDGWLFYRPDVNYLTSPGFLDPSELRRKSHGSHAIQPDPIAGILDFNRQLRQRGIRLILLPMTTKPMVEPEMLSRSLTAQSNLQNPSYGEFQRRLTQEGVEVFDPTPVLWKSKTETGHAQYLSADTHWTPRGVDCVAKAVAEEIQKTGDLPTIPNPGFKISERTITNVGDIAEMLKLPKDQTLYPKQMVTTSPITMADSSPWRPDPKADVLLLGDSFTNIYSMDQMGWGSSAGFAEQLSYNLKRPIDKIAVNAGGAFSSRRVLAQQMASGTDRLEGKRLVIYEFSMRDLVEGDWKLIEMPYPAQQTSPIPPTKPVPVKVPDQKTPQPPISKSNTTGVNPPIQSKTGSLPVKPGTKDPKGTPKSNLPAPTKTNQGQGLPPKKDHSNVLKSDGLVVTGRIAARSVAPKPGSVPYKDCLIALQLTDIKASGGTVKGANIVVYVWGMRDNQLVDGAYSVGQTIRFKLTPWASVDAKYGGFNRQELDSDDSLSWPSYWGEITP